MPTQHRHASRHTAGTSTATTGHGKQRSVRSALFATWYSALMAAAEPVFLRPLRVTVLASARGKLLFVGLGPGHDLRYLPSAVTSVTAVEPNPLMRRQARRRAVELGVELELLDGVAESLPFPDNTFDTVVSPFVLCSIQDVPAALAEFKRVLRPDGELLVLEHVRATDGTLLGTAQDIASRPWQICADGCHPNRRTREALRAAGFNVELLADGQLPIPVPVAPYLVGRATVR
ncbi:class I SAM-dependent methyltransferase [Nocardia sp. NPDC051570]|uniref:class I SAM-dependent methyltransferase n=1 Tax=Nocardia sp. NPDC051570 TaxID=3364324 RepID=UPI003797A7E0